MSTSYSGVNYAKTQASPITQIDEGQYNAPMLKILDQFVLTADLASNDTILVGGPIPEGAVVLNAKVSTGALGGSAAINFGIQAGAAALTGAGTPMAADASAFFSALPVSSATWAAAYGSTYQGDYYTQSPYTSQAQPVITCSVATSGATGKSIYIEIDYTKNGG
jgi:hypothetical protein